MSVPTPILQYNLSDASVKGLLPSGYTPLAYILSTGTLYIDTESKLASTDTIYTKVRWTQIGNYTLFASKESSGWLNGKYLGLTYYSGDKIHYSRSATVSSSTSSTRYYVNVGDSYEIVLKGSENKISYNGIVITGSGNCLTTDSFTCDYNMFLFASNGSGTASLHDRAKMYYFIATKSDGSLRVDLRPARRDSDGVIGMYDLVSKTFKTNSGSGEFIAGPELAIGKSGGKSLPEEYQLVEYLESHGNTNSPYLSFTNRTLLADDIVQINTSLNRKNNGTLPTWLGGSEVLIFISSGNLAYWRSANVEAVSPSSGTSITLNLRYIIKSKIKKTVDTWGLFAYSSGSYPIDGKIEMMSVTRGSSVILKLIPCYRKSDMKPGMYDVVNGEFKTSVASGEFILGPSITNCYTSESNAGSETLQGLYTNISGVYDSSKGWVADFNGNTSKLISLSNPSFVLPLSVSCWINFSVINSNFLYAISYNRNNGGTSDHLFGIGIKSNKLAFWSCGDAALIDDSISTNTWYHVTLTINSSKQATFYLNGVLKYQGTPGSSSIAATDFWIGCRCAGEYWFDGMLSNVQIWNTVLTAAQVKELYGK